jgi:uncharacterized protein (TIGR03435 family)
MPVTTCFRSARVFCAALFLLSFAPCAAVAQTSAASPAFEAASIKPAEPRPGGGLAALREDIESGKGSLTMRNVRLSAIVRWAYHLSLYEIEGPQWIDQTRYDIIAKPEHEASEDQLRLMLRSLLADRFKLESHRQQKELAGYALIKAVDEPKLKAAEGGGEGSMTGVGLIFEGHKMPLSRLADVLSSALKTPVRDATGLDGFYDFKLDLRPYITPRQPGDPPLDLTGIAITALREQLGLKLESRKSQFDILVVDRAEKTPTEN